jgi:hypothetical protein
VAEWLCSGLQSRLCRFDSDPSLHFDDPLRRSWRLNGAPKLPAPSSANRRQPLRFVRTLLFTAVAAIPAIVLLNLSWFDEPLLPELEALRKPQPVTLDANAFPFALGFLAAEGRDPRAAGVEIIGILRARRDRGEPATIGKEEKQAILGAPLEIATAEPPTARVSSLGLVCQPRHRLDCAHR